MSNQPLSTRLSRLNPSVLRGIPHGLEKENLRTRPYGMYGILAYSPHPTTSDSLRTLPCITTNLLLVSIE